jgi:predicted phage baseplate assembly protein
MTIAAPLVDPRTAEDVASQLKQLLRDYAPEYKGIGTDPITGELVPDSRAAALIGVFGRFAELIIERLNRVPDKNQLAFFDLLGASRLPPQPSRVPLTFSLAKGSASPGVVPAGTQVASPPAEGEKDPVIFETERELVVTPAVVASAFVRDPDVDSYADLGAIVTGAPAQGVRLFRGERIIEHSVYFGQRRLLEFNGITSWRVAIGLAAPLKGERTVAWEAWNGTEFKELFSRREDTTESLRTPGQVDLGAIDPVPLSTIHGIESRWLRCRLATVINLSDVDRQQMVRADDLPVIESVTAAVNVERSELAIDGAFANAGPIDATKDFFPFGETPRFGDTFFLRADEPFSVPGATVRVHVTLTNPKGSGSRSPAEVATSDVTLTWEIGTGNTWLPLGTSTPASSTASGGSDTFVDGTAALTTSGDVEFVCPQHVSKTIVNGIEGYWIRARITGGDYGHEARYVKQGETFIFDPATFAPPVITTARAAYTFAFEAGPDAVLTSNDFAFEDVSARHDREGESFAPFLPTTDSRPTAYVGFELPAGVTSFPNRAVSLFARTADIRFGEAIAPVFPTESHVSGAAGSTVVHRLTITNADPAPVIFAFGALGQTFQPRPQFPGPITLAPGASADVDITVRIPDQAPLGTTDTAQLAVIRSTNPDSFDFVALVTTVGPAVPSAEPVRLTWEYWNGKAFSTLTMLDGTNSLTRSGTLEFLAPRDFSARADFGLGPRFWIRVRWEKGDYAVEPRLVRLLLNTTMAAQTATRRNEVLGSSDGSKSLKLRATRTPILPGQRLEVLEPELPTTTEREALAAEEGADAITPVFDARGQTRQAFVRWHETPDFYASGPRDRHYVIDRFTGQVRFGDGLNGLVPPPGIGNIRLATYQTGGGRAGNRSAGSITQLKTTVPYVDKVTNLEPAAGGADAEPLDALLDRAPREVRHGGRAVTIEDYEDVAHLASAEVARAKCVPLADLIADPLEPAPSTAGVVSLIVVPRSSDIRPLPSVELIRRVQDFLDAVHEPTARLRVVGPLYVRVDVTAEIGLVAIDRATDIVAAVRQAVASFLHPLTGGLDGKGWDFGRRPHLSDLYALIEAVPGVDHIRSLDVAEVEDVAGVTLTGRFLVYSGEPAISAVLEDV